jgi:16S rRNA (cytosine967-C5)-methyltransferase
MPISPARLAGFQILLRVEQQNAYASELLHSGRLDALSPADRGLCTELVMGCLRWQATLDRLLAGASSQSLNKLDKEVLVALRLGAYQLRFLSRIPPNAAVNESVELAKRARKKSAAPFVNAILRKLAREGAAPSAEACSSGVPGGVEEPHSPGAVAGAFSPGSPAGAAVAPVGVEQALAAAWSHPEWLVARWIEQYGGEAAARVCEFDQQTPITALRLPTSPELAEPLERELQAEACTPASLKPGLPGTPRVELAPGNLLRSARVVRAGDVTHTRAYREARIAIQDEASQLVAALVGPSPAERKSGRGVAPPPPAAGLRLRILDCCAAPGGKTAAIAEANPQATVLAVELHPRRAELLRQRLQGSSGAGRIEVLTADATRLPHGREFDRVLADVPCSGTGTLARHPEIKWKLRPAELPGLHQRQAAILSAALGHLAPGGVLVYSTCSLEAEENASVVEEVLRQNSSAKLLDCAARLRELQEAGELNWPDVESLCHGPYMRTLPGVHPCDGFFAAMITL